MQVNNSKLVNEFRERLIALTEDHYCLRVKTESQELLFAKLKHMANGNSITLSADLRTGVLTQKTNGVVKYHGCFYPTKPTNIPSRNVVERF